MRRDLCYRGRLVGGAARGTSVDRAGMVPHRRDASRLAADVICRPRETGPDNNGARTSGKQNARTRRASLLGLVEVARIELASRRAYQYVYDHRLMKYPARLYIRHIDGQMIDTYGRHGVYQSMTREKRIIQRNGLLCTDYEGVTGNCHVHPKRSDSYS